MKIIFFDFLGFEKFQKPKKFSITLQFQWEKLKIAITTFIILPSLDFEIKNQKNSKV